MKIIHAHIFVFWVVNPTHIEALLSTPNRLRIVSSCTSNFATSQHTKLCRTERYHNGQDRGGMFMYTARNREENSNVWSVLTKTESWITKTFENLNDAASASISSAKSTSKRHPYIRKQISYACESSQESALCVSSIFTHIKECREMGENHSHFENDKKLYEDSDSDSDSDSDYETKTMRLTQVVIIPYCKDFSKCYVFEDTIEAINHARRRAREYVTDFSIKGKTEDDQLEMDWNVGISVSTLHPDYGNEKPHELYENKINEIKGNNVELKKYIDSRNRARQSPYPSLILEVNSSPPIDFSSDVDSSTSDANDEENMITSNDVKNLENIFTRKSVLRDEVNSDDGVEELSTNQMFTLTRNWIENNDHSFDGDASMFSISDLTHVDTAYEFVFNNIAAHLETYWKQEKKNDIEKIESGKLTDGSCTYLILNKFVSKSATSLEKFSNEVENIISKIPTLSGIISLKTFHPEHVEDTKRSPTPVIALHWLETGRWE